ncbi:hypothetical protein ACTXT7_006484 [Hymenolepis weldensis]
MPNCINIFKKKEGCGVTSKNCHAKRKATGSIMEFQAVLEKLDNYIVPTTRSHKILLITTSEKNGEERD